jgi:hypothetical protein
MLKEHILAKDSQEAFAKGESTSVHDMRTSPELARSILGFQMYFALKAA